MFPRMEKFAVIRAGGKQYRVSEGDVLEVDRLSPTKKEMEFGDVLLYVDQNSTKVGQPTVSAKVKATVLEDTKGQKIRVFKYKAKTQYHKTRGFRAKLTKVRIEKIDLGSKKNGA